MRRIRGREISFPLDDPRKLISKHILKRENKHLQNKLLEVFHEQSSVWVKNSKPI